MSGEDIRHPALITRPCRLNTRARGDRSCRGRPVEFSLCTTNRTRRTAAAGAPGSPYAANCHRLWAPSDRRRRPGSSTLIGARGASPQALQVGQAGNDLNSNGLLSPFDSTPAHRKPRSEAHPSSTATGWPGPRIPGNPRIFSADPTCECLLAGDPSVSPAPRPCSTPASPIAAGADLNAARIPFADLPNGDAQSASHKASQSMGHLPEAVPAQPRQTLDVEATPSRRPTKTGRDVSTVSRGGPGSLVIEPCISKSVAGRKDLVATRQSNAVLVCERARLEMTSVRSHRQMAHHLGGRPLSRYPTQRRTPGGLGHCPTLLAVVAVARGLIALPVHAGNPGSRADRISFCGDIANVISSPEPFRAPTSTLSLAKDGSLTRAAGLPNGLVLSTGQRNGPNRDRRSAHTFDPSPQ